MRLESIKSIIWSIWTWTWTGIDVDTDRAFVCMILIHTIPSVSIRAFSLLLQLKNNKKNHIFSLVSLFHTHTHVPLYENECCVMLGCHVFVQIIIKVRPENSMKSNNTQHSAPHDRKHMEAKQRSRHNTIAIVSIWFFAHRKFEQEQNYLCVEIYKGKYAPASESTRMESRYMCMSSWTIEIAVSGWAKT